MNVTGMFQSDAMLRQISESIQINKVQLINTKSEWSYFQIPRAVVTGLTMPSEFFFLTEVHMGGCGCYTSSDRWTDADGTAIGFR